MFDIYLKKVYHSTVFAMVTLFACILNVLLSIGLAASISKFFFILLIPSLAFLVCIWLQEYVEYVYGKKDNFLKRLGERFEELNTANESALRVGNSVVLCSIAPFVSIAFIVGCFVVSPKTVMIVLAILPVAFIPTIHKMLVNKGD